MQQLVNSTRMRNIGAVVLALVVTLVATVFPRLMLAGGLPATDEGFYAFQAQLVHASIAAGNGLPDAGTLTLYPMLLSWVYALPFNPLVALRLADLLVATVASWLLFRVLTRECGSLAGGALIALVFLFFMNQPLFIQYGFKNSNFAAYVPLFIALQLGGGPGKARPSFRALMVAGGCAAFGVLLRETFISFFLLGALAIAIAYGWRACLRFILGAAAVGGTVILLIVTARGGGGNLIESYRSAGLVYASLAEQRMQFFLESGLASTEAAWPALLLAVLGCLAVLASLFVAHRNSLAWRGAFWGGAALLPLLEPIFKIGFPYHFAVCLPGLAGLAAVGWRCTIAAVNSGASCSATVLIFLVVVGLGPKVMPLVNEWPLTQSVLRSAGTGAWPDHAIAQSNYLLAAEEIRKVAPAGGSLSVSGFMFALYPLSGLLPPKGDLSNLSATLIQLGLDGSRFREALLACPPDVLMTTTRMDWPGTVTLGRTVVDSGLYQEVADIPVAQGKSYGTFGGTIYKRVQPKIFRCSGG